MKFSYNQIAGQTRSGWRRHVRRSDDAAFSRVARPGGSRFRLSGRLALQCAASRVPVRAVSGSCCTRFGAAVCVIHTYWSIAFIVLVQRNSPLPFGRKKNQELSLLFS